MKKSILSKASLSLVLLGCLASCQPKVTTSQITAGISMTASSKAATVASNKNIWSILLPQANAFISPSMVDSTGAGVNLTNAWVCIKEIEFEASEVPGAAEVDGDDISFRGPYYVDMLSSTPAALDTQLITAGTYQRIKMKLHSSGGVIPTGVPAQLSDNSIYLQGVVGARNFTFQLDDSTEINIGGANPVVPADGGSLLIEVNLANIFKQIDLSTVTNNEVISASARHAGTSLCNAIDASANDIYTCIRKGLEKHADFGKDSDNNGDLGASEDSVK